MWNASAEILVTDLGDELVLMHPARSEMFSLNAAGRLVWQALPGTLDDLAKTLASTYGLEDGQARGDVQVVLDELLIRELVRRD